MFEYTKTVQDAINNDQNAFELLYNNSYGVVKREALKYMKNDFDADDVIQNTYLSIFKNLKNLDNPEKFIPWSVTICRNTCLNEVKRKNRVSEETEFRPLVSEDDKEGLDTIPASSYDLTLNPSAAVDASETKRLLDEMIGELPVMQRACIIMWQENYSSKEIADELEIPDGTVKSNISYAKKKIKEKVLKLEKDGTKLYGLSPVGFFLWILGRYDQIFQPASIIGKASGGYLAISEALDIGSGATAASGTVAVASESVAAESAGGTAAHTAATAGTKVIAKGLLSKVIGGSVASKVIAAIVTVSLIAGVSTGVNAIIKERKAESVQETVQEENQNPDANTEDTTDHQPAKILENVVLSTNYYNYGSEEPEFIKKYMYYEDGSIMAEMLYSYNYDIEADGSFLEPVQTVLYVRDKEGNLIDSLYSGDIYDYYISELTDENSDDLSWDDSWTSGLDESKTKDTIGSTNGVALGHRDVWRSYLKYYNNYIKETGFDMIGGFSFIDDDGIPEMELVNLNWSYFYFCTASDSSSDMIKSVRLYTTIPGENTIFHDDVDLDNHFYYNRIYHIENGKFVVDHVGKFKYKDLPYGAYYLNPEAFEYERCYFDEKEVSESEYYELLNKYGFNKVECIDETFVGFQLRDYLKAMSKVDDQ